MAGAGACLKRYTDPSFFKAESASSVRATVQVHREKRIRKVKVQNFLRYQFLYSFLPETCCKCVILTSFMLCVIGWDLAEYLQIIIEIE